MSGLLECVLWFFMAMISHDACNVYEYMYATGRQSVMSVNANKSVVIIIRSTSYMYLMSPSLENAGPSSSKMGWLPT